MFGVHQHLDIAICEDAQDAINKGFNYNAANGGTPRTAVEIEKLVIVRNGTVEGNATVDLLLQDEAGNKFVVMVTGNLLKTTLSAL